MAYDPEKYREKREKVLGLRKRSLSFGMISTIVSVIILIGLSAVTLPQVAGYLSTRHLDDAIFKLESGLKWPSELLAEIKGLENVDLNQGNKEQARLVVTYDRRSDTLKKVTALFDTYGLTVTLLNSVGHRQHLKTMKQEEKELETP